MLALRSFGIQFLALVLVGCGGGKDDSASVAPDVTGRYNVSVDGASGCQDTYAYWTAWANGPLLISGDSSDNLVFEFYDGMTFGGFVDASWTFEFGGEVEWNDKANDIQALLSISSRGGFTQEGDEYIGTSDTLEILVDDDEIKSNNCTVQGLIRMTEL